MCQPERRHPELVHCPTELPRVQCFSVYMYLRVDWRNGVLLQRWPWLQVLITPCSHPYFEPCLHCNQKATA